MKISTIAEIGINFAYGDDINKFVDNAKLLIDAAAVAGFDYVKFQKRNPDVCVPGAEKLKMKSVPWREEEITYLQYKKDIELTFEQYVELTNYALSKGMELFVSVWDTDSVRFAADLWYETHKDKNFSHPIIKIPSALITNIYLLTYARSIAGMLMISTGMSDEDEINRAIGVSNPDIVFHTNSVYPSKSDELNLMYIKHLEEKYPKIHIGYSGHEYGLTTTFAAAALGAKIIERHVTLDRMLWGSDQLASVEPIGQIKLIKGIREIEKALGCKGPRFVSQSELLKRKTLRGV